jgi:hypothetical protein
MPAAASIPSSSRPRVTSPDRLSFDYQSDNAPLAGYNLEFPGAGAPTLQERLPVSGPGWQRFARVVEVPAGATSALLTVYSYSDDGGQENIVTRYDSFSLQELSLVASLPPAPADAQYDALPFFAFPSAGSGAVFTFVDPAVPTANIIPDPSFESGLWADAVGDCNRYDSHGDVDMARVPGGSHGQYVLELGATRHIACTGPSLLPVKEGSRYLFSFAYQSPNGLAASYYIGFNDPDLTTVRERLPLGDSNWHLLNRQIEVPAGATSASIVVYSYDEGSGRRIVTRYDNFSFSPLPDLFDRYYLVSRPSVPARAPREVAFETLGPAKTLVHVRGATGPFYLALSEAYHDRWQLQFAGDRTGGLLSWLPWPAPERIADARHFALDGFLNGWYVDTADACARGHCTVNADGSRDLELVVEFYPQRWFLLGLALSGMAAAACLLWAGISASSRRKRLPRRTHA